MVMDERPAEISIAIANTIPEKIIAGEELYAFYCAECHGPDGEGGEIVGVEGLEGVVVKSISSQDEMYTRSDATLFDIIDFGQPSLGMPPNGTGHGGELGPGEMDAIVVFMRYTWDDRAEVPAEVSVGFSIPPLAEGEVPSYEVHIAPLVKRFCVSCHRPGKETLLSLGGNALEHTFYPPLLPRQQVDQRILGPDQYFQLGFPVCYHNLASAPAPLPAGGGIGPPACHNTIISPLFVLDNNQFHIHQSALSRLGKRDYISFPS